MQFLQPAGEFIAQAREIEWTVEGVVETSTLAVLFGDPSAGKTFVALDMALCVATGAPWLGSHKVEQGHVIYIASEGHGAVRRRLRAWCEARGLADDEIAKLPLHVTRYAVQLNDEERVGAIMGEIDAANVNPILVVIDTLTGATPGLDQNSARDMSEFVETLRDLRDTFGCAVLVVHHSGHREKHRAKGAIDLLAACDAEIGVMKLARQTDTLRFSCTKMRNGEPFDDIYLRIKSSPPAAVLELVDAPTAAIRLSPSDKLFADVIGDAAVHESDACAAFKAKYKGSDGAKRNAWARAFARAIERGAYVYDAETGVISRAGADQSS